MINKVAKGIKLFFNPMSSVAIHKKPGRFGTVMLALIMNGWLRGLDFIWPRHQVECSVCGWRGRKFGYAAALSTDFFAANDICLNCGSNKRTRVTLEVLISSIDLAQENLMIIDIGPASSTKQYFKRYPNVRYLTLDKFKHANINSDVTDIPLANNSADVIICCHVLEHIEDYCEAMSELFRILKPDHYGIIVVPQRTTLERSRRVLDATFQGYGHIWEFGDDFSEKLTQVGFQVSTVYKFIYAPTKRPLHVILKPQIIQDKKDEAFLSLGDRSAFN